MIKCSCGKQIENVPDWLASVKVDFVCNNCPDRDIKSIADIKLTNEEEEKAPSKAAKGSESIDDDMGDEEDDD
ncbi:hypothetical protein QPK87_09970 [Kamptonema cortianum]|nr:hypothetical protein [Geitlerinema splendidum]MDK3156902.1 hypothetical protein [Kamptonema cortianum]